MITMSDNLIGSIGEQLNIPFSADNDGLCQIIYSVAGKMALASLWDRDENDHSISIRHFKKRVAQIFEAYEDIYLRGNSCFSQDKTDIISDIYNIYLRSGFFYHSSHKIVPAIPGVATNNGIAFHRGCSIDNNLYMSGLGYYSNEKCESGSSLRELFGLQECSFEDYLEEILSDSEWEQIDWPDSAEFLRIDPPFKFGYWKQIPDKDGRISLARYGEPNKSYVFYRCEAGVCQQKMIPEWRLKDYFSNDESNHEEYRRIATALLDRYKILPKIRAIESDDYVVIKLGYRLPPSEEIFFRLYSWPMRYDYELRSPQVFNRKMAKQIFPAFKNVLESLGYCFVEG